MIEKHVLKGRRREKKEEGVKNNTIKSKKIVWVSDGFLNLGW